MKNCTATCPNCGTLCAREEHPDVFHQCPTDSCPSEWEEIIPIRRADIHLFLTGIMEVADKATAQPWAAIQDSACDYECPDICSLASSGGPKLVARTVPARNGVNDGAFIAQARAAVPRLCRIIDNLLKEIEGFVGIGLDRSVPYNTVKAVVDHRDEEIKTLKAELKKRGWTEPKKEKHGSIH